MRPSPQPVPAVASPTLAGRLSASRQPTWRHTRITRDDTRLSVVLPVPFSGPLTGGGRNLLTHHRENCLWPPAVALDDTLKL